jgi:hypothetical protein
MHWGRKRGAKKEISRKAQIACLQATCVPQAKEIVGS